MKVSRLYLATAVWVLLGASRSVLFAQSSAGSSVKVSGNVRDAKGNAVGGITVIAQAGGKADVESRGETDSKGMFLLTLHPGTYKVFAFDDNRGYPDCRLAFFSCDGVPVTIQANGVPLPITVIISKGSYLEGEIVDSQTASKINQAFVVVKRADDYYYDSRALVDSSFRVLVPADTDLILAIAAVKYRYWTYRDVTSGDVSFKVPVGENFKVKIEMFRVEP